MVRSSSSSLLVVAAADVARSRGERVAARALAAVSRRWRCPAQRRPVTEKKTSNILHHRRRCRRRHHRRRRGWGKRWWRGRLRRRRDDSRRMRDPRDVRVSRLIRLSRPPTSSSSRENPEIFLLFPTFRLSPPGPAPHPPFFHVLLVLLVIPLSFLLLSLSFSSFFSFFSSLSRPRFLHDWYSRLSRLKERRREIEWLERIQQNPWDPRFHFRHRLSDTCVFFLTLACLRCYLTWNTLHSANWWTAAYRVIGIQVRFLPWGAKSNQAEDKFDGRKVRSFRVDHAESWKGGKGRDVDNEEGDWEGSWLITWLNQADLAWYGNVQNKLK